MSRRPADATRRVAASRTQQTIFLIDGSHYDRLRSVLESPFDLSALAHIASNGAPLDHAIYYRDVRDESEEARQRSLFGWLKHNGFTVKGRRHSSGEPRERYGTNLVELAVDALLLAHSGDRVLILAADAKLAPLLAALRDDDIDVTLISTEDAPNTIAPARHLIENANRFLELKSVLEWIALGGPRGGPENAS
ncbi:NYN domain-containing protein [Sinorhizobium meliloti]|nr:NYN domain-containing protein [Sinorhizobium meliloti]WQP36186.1 NYN domain-containing protein [Sinorhizobium meliloti]